MLSQIIFIYRDEFVSQLVEKLMEKASINCYGLSKVEENFAYLIDDLRPQLVIVDELAYQKSAKLIKESLADANSDFKTVILHKSDKDSSEFDLSLDLPININTFVDEVRSLVEQKS